MPCYGGNCDKGCRMYARHHAAILICSSCEQAFMAKDMISEKCPHCGLNPFAGQENAVRFEEDCFAEGQ